MTKLTTVKRKANVGEKIMIMDAYQTFGDYENGDILTVSSKYSDFGVRSSDLGSAAGFIGHDEYEVIEVMSDNNERLASAEAKIAALEAEVGALKQADLRRDMAGISNDGGASITLNGSFLPPLPGEVIRFRGVKASDFSKTPPASPNQRRADVIKRAQAFVEDLEDRAIVRSSNTDGNSTFNYKRTKLTFHVNAEKGVVTALSRLLGEGRTFKAFANCHPNDVFNADIGKAIAAGKLYGVDYTTEFVDAPKPAEVVVGMREESIACPGETYLITRIAGGKAHVNGTDQYWRTSRINEAYVILEDTDAVYS